MRYLNLKYVLILLHLAIALDIDAEDEVRNFTIYEVTAFNARERAVLYNVYATDIKVNFVNSITNEAAIPMDVLVDNCCSERFEALLEHNNIEYVKIKVNNFVNQNFNHLITQEDDKQEPNPKTDFLDYSKIRKWVQYKTKRHSILQDIVIGRSYEKRDIFVLKITTGKANKAVVLMGGEEGRDWASIAMLLNLVDSILNKQSKLDNLTSLYDLYILPIFNPDGYMYSMKTDRQWKKNTRAYMPKKPCVTNISTLGINVDRNWYFHAMTGRNEECDPNFAGWTPLSEDETIAAYKFLDSIALKMMAFINIRGFENLVTIPYAYAKEYCNNYDVLFDIISTVHAAVIKQHNTSFSYGLASDFLYNMSGTAPDWVKKQLNTPIVYTFYIKDDNYVLPSPKDIQPQTAQLATMLKEILELGHNFYNPLFNHQCRHSSVDILIKVFFFIVIILN